MSTTDDIILYNTEEKLKVEPPKKQIPLFNLVPENHPILTKVLPDFDFSNPPVDPNMFASSLVETCKKNNGYGLSANQCGFEHRVFVMGTGDEYVAYFNPKLIDSEGESHIEEGCLSFPLLGLRITRPKKITVEYQDFTGQTHTKIFDGITARCFLHELDHMNGIVYTSRVKPLALAMGLKKRSKFVKKYFRK